MSNKIESKFRMAHGVVRAGTAGCSWRICTMFSDFFFSADRHPQFCRKSNQFFLEDANSSGSSSSKNWIYVLANHAGI